MKIPETPPDFTKAFDAVSRDQKKSIKLLMEARPTDEEGRYLHWEEMKYRNPKGFTPEEWWVGVKLSRHGQRKNTPFHDKEGRNITHVLTDGVLADLHRLDKSAAGDLSSSGLSPGDKEMESYMIRSFVEEAISSSQLEGAATTRKVARQMLRENRKPQDGSERMIFNNYGAMRHIEREIDKPLTAGMILNLHEILTDGTMENPAMAGKIRKTDDVQVWDERDGKVIHAPPAASTLPERMEILCDFANDDAETHFIHPIIKAILLHYMLAYDHPFEDGNGRVARALFYWSAAKSGYWLMKYISISTVIRRERDKYYRAFLHSETDESDATYFVIQQLDVIKKAISEYRDHLKKNMEETREAMDLLGQRQELNTRQIHLLRDALKHPDRVYTIRGHMGTHNVVYETARTDLLEMAEKHALLVKRKAGRTFVFTPAQDLKKRIAR